MDEMSDRDFLDYCLAMADTPRCGFAPKNVGRLIRLAGGSEEWAAHWEAKAPNVYDIYKGDIRTFVENARSRLALSAEREPDA